MKERVAVVTGASSGLGRYAALALKKGGYKVIAGARSFSYPENHLGQGIHCLPLDVTDDESMKRFFEIALEQKVDMLVNCAGVLVLGACEELSTSEYQRVMETNFFGMVRAIQGILPHFRQNRAGRIVNFSSINGLLGIPFQSAYTASKHAIEGYSECLQMEVKPFGIEVMVVEPGDHRGGSGKYRGQLNKADSPYGRNQKSAIRAIQRDEANGLAPQALGEKLVKVLNKKRLPFRLRIAKGDQHLAAILHKLFPIKWLFRILSKYYLK